MPRATLPSFRFERGIVIRRSFPAWGATTRKDVVTWHLIGRLEEGTPFFLQYTEPGTTAWTCAQNLGPSLRRKILAGLRTQVRNASWTAFPLQTHDLRELDARDFQEGQAETEKISGEFLEAVWRRQYLSIREEDFIVLAVPFAEKDEAKALGAKWDAQAKVWKVQRQLDMSAFSRWLAPGPECEAP